jgi:hypothetical protein
MQPPRKHPENFGNDVKSPWRPDPDSIEQPGSGKASDEVPYEFSGIESVFDLPPPIEPSISPKSDRDLLSGFLTGQLHGASASAARRL